MANGDPMRETVFLRDIHRWSVDEHVEYLEGLNKSIDALSRDARTAADAFTTTDHEGAKSFNRLQGS